MENVQSTINLILKAVAVGMSVATVVLGFLVLQRDFDSGIIERLSA